MAYTIIYILLAKFVFSPQNSVADTWERLQDDGEIYSGLMYPYETHVSNFMWDLVGNSMILNNKIVLTNDRKSQIGGIWCLSPYYGKYWAVEIEFNIYNSNGDLFGDGMAFWYAQDPNKIGTAFGYQNLFYGLGIFFDTFNNREDNSVEYPYITASVSNRSVPYDHKTDGIGTALAGCSKSIRNHLSPTRALIIYDDDQLSVYIKDYKSSPYSHEGLEECFSIPNVHLPGGLHFGVTAATGDLTDNHELISIRVLSLDTEDVPTSGDIFNVEPRVENAETLILDSKDQIKRGFSIVLIVILFIGSVIAFLVCYFFNGSSRDKLF